MRTVTPAVVGAVLLGTALALAACAGSSGNTGAPPPSPGVNAVPPAGSESGPPPLPDATRASLPAPSPRDPVPGSRDRAVPWTLAGTAEGGRLLLLDVTVGGPPCDLVTAVDVAESASAVRITVHAGKPAGASCAPGPLPAIAAIERVRVRLAAPLAGRTTVDGR
jgi:hypothetical protein